MLTKDVFEFIFKLRSSGFTHHTPENENKLINVIFKNQGASYNKILEDLDGEIGVLANTDSKNIKNLYIGSVFLVCRIAIENGADSEYAFGLSDYYINKAESIKNPDTFTELFEKLILSYKTLINFNQDKKYPYPIDNCMHYINQNLYSPLTVKKVSDYIKMNPSYLTTLFKQKTGTTLYKYIQQRKIEEACIMIKNTNNTISIISSALGYNSLSHFSKAFKSIMNIPPTKYRKSV